MSSEFDIIIVGGGTAGLVLASRLSENPDLHVLVLEAGQDQTQDPRVVTPALWSALVGTDSSWNFMTEPQVLTLEPIVAAFAHLTTSRPPLMESKYPSHRAAS